MANDAQIVAVRGYVSKVWPELGACRSCGWHASLHEYHWLEEDIEEAIDDKSALILPCMRGDESGAFHRGARIDIPLD